MDPSLVMLICAPRLHVPVGTTTVSYTAVKASPSAQPVPEKQPSFWSADVVAVVGALAVTFPSIRTIIGCGVALRAPILSALWVQARRAIGLALFVVLLPLPAAADDAQFLTRRAPDHLRVLSQNSGSGSIFADGEPALPPGVEARHERFARVLRAIEPDVVCFQEVRDPRTAADAAHLLDHVLPLGGTRWQAHQWSGNVVASRFPLRPLPGYEAVHGVRGARGHAVAIVEVPSETGTRELAVVCTHMDSRDQTGARLVHTAALLDSVAEARAGGRRAVLLTGDLNAYATDNAPHVAAMLAWAIDGEVVLRDPTPRINAAGTETWTFKSVNSPHPPAALDRMLFTAATLDPVHGFVLDTTTLSESTLAAVGLRPHDVRRDVQTGSLDHLPVVVDFVFQP
jgi:endonuclease/exonuclease/phosphatase family metal-dependent hydrolase